MIPVKIGERESAPPVNMEAMLPSVLAVPPELCVLVFTAND
jgi:hypothetical protein